SAQFVTIGTNPLFGFPGDSIAITIYTHPPVGGVSCTFSARDGDFNIIAEGEPQLTAPGDGAARWTLVIPADAVPGSGRANAHCEGLFAQGGAQLRIVPAQGN
ncbi:MAG TPA: hypothetical protein PJ994_05420, partial [Tepidiformaceae bacterium]|nr:hypothetical protein [Tepidiformaceae bacterium]